METKYTVLPPAVFMQNVKQWQRASIVHCGRHQHQQELQMLNITVSTIKSQ